MRVRPFLALAALALTAGAPPPASSSTSGSWEGTWRNTRNTVHLRAERCGNAMCGTVVWAVPKAQADARQGNGRSLIGAQLFRDFRPANDGRWKGKVYLPDLDRNAAATVTPTGRDTMLVQGCLFFGLACKTQHWWRIS